MSFYQISLIILALLLFYSGVVNFLKYKKARFFALLAVSLFILLFAISPQLARDVSMYLGIGENLNTLIFTGFVILFIFVVKLTSSVEKLKREVTFLVREQALMRFHGEHATLSQQNDNSNHDK